MATRTMNDDAFKLEGPGYNSLGTDLVITTTTTALLTTRAARGTEPWGEAAVAASTTEEMETVPLKAEVPEVDRFWAGVCIVCILGIVVASYHLCSLTKARRRSSAGEESELSSRMCC